MDHNLPGMHGLLPLPVPASAGVYPPRGRATRRRSKLPIRCNWLHARSRCRDPPEKRIRRLDCLRSAGPIACLWIRRSVGGADVRWRGRVEHAPAPLTSPSMGQAGRAAPARRRPSEWVDRPCPRVMTAEFRFQSTIEQSKMLPPPAVVLSAEDPKSNDPTAIYSGWTTRR